MAKLTKKEQQQYDKCLGQCTQCLIRLDCKLRIKIKDIQSVDIIVSSYAWTCPECKLYYVIPNWITMVGCRNCGKEFQAKSPEHALGK